MLLPNADQAIIDDQKITDYVLNPEHEEGKHKAFVFKSVLGITASEANEMKAQILLELFRNPAHTGREDKHGKRYSVKFDWTRSGRTATVLTSWIIRTGESAPRLTSCYII
ncbi:DUF6883 domain-containing protein [Spirosoma validum]|uniref:DUF6883 domain-containing protein n=1 Tax=Spirosoma validum TaxID=2771355 RepID=A0A927B8Q3_9BACT|nr:DUF6883 domain-containing protein [Spirosoma validum]MBD2757790.1 hypothetical protein [Spirosoma validum]